jgi:hypothetical protein
VVSQVDRYSNFYIHKIKKKDSGWGTCTLTIHFGLKVRYLLCLVKHSTFNHFITVMYFGKKFEVPQCVYKVFHEVKYIKFYEEIPITVSPSVLQFNKCRTSSKFIILQNFRAIHKRQIMLVLSKTSSLLQSLLKKVSAWCIKGHTCLWVSWK